MSNVGNVSNQQDTRSFFTKAAQYKDAAQVAIRFRGLSQENKDKLIESMRYENGQVVATEPINGNKIIIAKGFNSKTEADFFMRELKEVHGYQEIHSTVNTVVKKENFVRREYGQKELSSGHKTIVRKTSDYNENKRLEIGEKIHIEYGSRKLEGTIYKVEENGNSKSFYITAGKTEQYKITIQSNSKKDDFSKAKIMRCNSNEFIAANWALANILGTPDNLANKSSQLRINAIRDGKDTYGIANLKKENGDQFIRAKDTLLKQIESDVKNYQVVGDVKGFLKFLETIKQEMQKAGIDKNTINLFMERFLNQKVNDLKQMPYTESDAYDTTNSTAKYNAEIDSTKATLMSYAKDNGYDVKKTPFSLAAIGNLISKPAQDLSRDKPVDDKYQPLKAGDTLWNRETAVLKNRADITDSNKVSAAIDIMAARHGTTAFKIRTLNNIKIKETMVLSPKDGIGVRTENVIIGQKNGLYYIVEPSTGATFSGKTEDEAMNNYCKGASTEPNSVIAFKDSNGQIQSKEVVYSTGKRIIDVGYRLAVAAVIIGTVIGTGGSASGLVVAGVGAGYMALTDAGELIYKSATGQEITGADVGLVAMDLALSVILPGAAVAKLGRGARAARIAKKDLTLYKQITRGNTTEIPVGINRTTGRMVIPNKDNVLDVSKLSEGNRSALHSLIQSKQKNIINQADFDDALKMFPEDIQKMVNSKGVDNIEALTAQNFHSYSHRFVDRCEKAGSTEIYHNHPGGSKKLSGLDEHTGAGVIDNGKIDGAGKKANSSWKMGAEEQPIVGRQKLHIIQGKNPLPVEVLNQLTPDLRAFMNGSSKGELSAFYYPQDKKIKIIIDEATFTRVKTHSNDTYKAFDDIYSPVITKKGDKVIIELTEDKIRKYVSKPEEGVFGLKDASGKVKEYKYTLDHATGEFTVPELKKTWPNPGSIHKPDDYIRQIIKDSNGEFIGGVKSKKLKDYSPGLVKADITPAKNIEVASTPKTKSKDPTGLGTERSIADNIRDPRSHFQSSNEGKVYDALTAYKANHPAATTDEIVELIFNQCRINKVKSEELIGFIKRLENAKAIQNNFFGSEAGLRNISLAYQSGVKKSSDGTALMVCRINDKWHYTTFKEAKKMTSALEEAGKLESWRFFSPEELFNIAM